MDILDWLTLASYLALNADIVLETRRIYTTKSSADLSILGMSIRFMALIIILAKFISLKDPALLVGQSLIALTFAIYFGLALAYFRNRNREKS